MAIGPYEARPAQYREMSGHGILRHIEHPGDFTGGQAVGFTTNEELERFEPRCLGKCTKSTDG